MADSPRKRKTDGRRTISVPRTEAQRQQSRANGSKSKGPKTEAGKAASSENALLHGFSGKMLVPRAHRRAYKSRSEAFAEEAGTSPLLQGLAGIAALAMTQTEVLCDSRNRTAEKKARRIRTQAERRSSRKLEEALQLWASGKGTEAIDALSRIPDGCRRISAWWSEVDQVARSVAMGTPLGPEFWARLDQLEPAIPREFRQYMRDSTARWRAAPTPPMGAIRSSLGVIVERWTQQADRLQAEIEEDLLEKIAHAHADIGRDGQQRHRYLQAAQNQYRQSARQILLERRRPGSAEEARQDKESGPPPLPETPAEMESPAMPAWTNRIATSAIQDRFGSDESEDESSDEFTDHPDPDDEPHESEEEKDAFLNKCLYGNLIPAQSILTDYRQDNSVDLESRNMAIPLVRSNPDTSSSVPGPSADWVAHPDGTVTPAVIGLRNEPENSTQALGKVDLAETSPSNQGPISGPTEWPEQPTGWHALVPMGMLDQPQVLAEEGPAQPPG
ncbi:MAG: hypothetical protein U0800_14090, partial [Isosphaeraceae bacterium]